MKKKLRLLFTLFMMACAIVGCGSNAGASDVKSVDDLEGKKIGVQIGTVGDTYASTSSPVQSSRRKAGSRMC